MVPTRQEQDDLVAAVLDVYRRTKQLERQATVPALARALELATMHLHQALWDCGAEVDLNPELDVEDVEDDAHDAAE